MQDGWYCRATTTLSQEEQPEQNVEVDDDEESTVDDDSREVHTAKAYAQPNQANPENGDPKAQYRYLKRKLKFLIYENEFLQEVLRSNQRRLLKVSRDRTFLLDRLLQYEKPDDSSESDLTESSDEEVVEAKKKKSETNTTLPGSNGAGSNTTAPTRGRKRKVPQNNGECSQEPTSSKSMDKAAAELTHSTSQRPEQFTEHDMAVMAGGGQFTDQMSEVVLDREGQEHLLDGSSHVAAEECVTMEYTAT